MHGHRILGVFNVLLVPRIAMGAFTLPTSSSNGIVQQNAQKTWCYYPAAGITRSTTCSVSDFNSVLPVHLNTTTSIGYYAPDNTRYGGAEWGVPSTNTGRVTLCVSGMAQDGTYQTACMFVTADNSLPSGGCEVVLAQTTVTDGCYTPGQPLAPAPSLPATSQTSQTTPSSSSIPPPSTDSPRTFQQSTSMTTTSSNPTTSSSNIPTTTPSGVAGASKNGGGLSRSDTIAIIFGIISALGVLGGFLRWRNERQRRIRTSYS